MVHCLILMLKQLDNMKKIAIIILCLCAIGGMSQSSIAPTAGTQISSPMVPTNDMAKLRGTHYSNWGVGGLKNVTRFTTMDSLYTVVTNTDQETAGTLCWVEDSLRYYYFNGVDWYQFLGFLQDSIIYFVGNLRFDGQLGINKTPERAFDLNGSMNIPLDSSYCFGGEPSLVISGGVSGNKNIALGYEAAKNGPSATWYYNIFIGERAGYNLSSSTTTYGNIGIGNSALRDISGPGYNIAIGTKSLEQGTTIYDNIAIGHWAAALMLTGDENTMVGYHVNQYGLTGSGNAYFGHATGQGNATGNYNAAFGAQSLVTNSGGLENSAFGYRALTSGSTGSYNVAVGSKAGYASAESHCVYIGYKAGYNNTIDSTLHVDVSETASPLIYGNFKDNTVYINGTLHSDNEIDADTGAITWGGIQQYDTLIIYKEISAVPGTPDVGTFIFQDDTLRFYNGTAWQKLY